MLDWDEIQKQLTAGMQDIDALSSAEKMSLVLYCNILGDDVILEGGKRNATVEECVTNAVRVGLATGLRLAILDQQVKVR